MAIIPTVRRQVAPAPIPGMQQQAQVPVDQTGNAIAGFGAAVSNSANKVLDVYKQEEEASQQQVVRDRLNKASVEAAAVQDAYNNTDYPDTKIAGEERVKTADKIKQIYDAASAGLNPYQAKLYTRAANDEVAARHTSVNRTWSAKDQAIQHKTMDATYAQTAAMAAEAFGNGDLDVAHSVLNYLRSTAYSDPRVPIGAKEEFIKARTGEVVLSSLGVTADKVSSDPSALPQLNTMLEDAVRGGHLSGAQRQQAERLVYRVNDQHDTHVQANDNIAKTAVAIPYPDIGPRPENVIDRMGLFGANLKRDLDSGSITQEKYDAVYSEGMSKFSQERTLITAELSRKTHEYVTAIKGAGTAESRALVLRNADPRLVEDLRPLVEQLDAQSDAALKRGETKQATRTPEYMAGYSEIANNLGLFYDIKGGIRDKEGESQLEIAMEKCGFREDDKATLRKARENKGQIDGLSVDDVGKWVERLTGKKKISEADKILYWDQVTRNFPKGTRANDATIREAVSKLVWDGEYTIDGETKRGDLAHALTAGAANWSPKFTDEQRAKTDAEMALTKQATLETKADIEKQLAEATPEQRPALVEQLKSIASYLEKLNPGARVLGYKPVTIEETIYKHPFVAGPGEKRFVLDGVVLPHGTVKVEKATKDGVPGANVTAWGFAGLGVSSQETRFIPAGTLYSADKPELDRNPDLWRAQYEVAKMKGMSVDPDGKLITPDVARQRMQEKLRQTRNAQATDEATRAASAEKALGAVRDYMNIAQVRGRAIYGHAALLHEADKFSAEGRITKWAHAYMDSTPGTEQGKTLLDEFIAARKDKSKEEQAKLARDAMYSIADIAKQ